MTEDKLEMVRRADKKTELVDRAQVMTKIPAFLSQPPDFLSDQPFRTLPSYSQ